MPYTPSKTDSATQLFAHYSKDMHIHAAACTTGGSITRADAPMLLRFPLKQYVKMQLLVMLQTFSSGYRMG